MSSVPLNRFLGSLTPASRNSLLAVSRSVDLPVDTVLCEANEEPKEAYFLDSGFCSEVITLEDAGSVEVGVTGCEGLVGHLSLMGRATAPSRSFMQAAGTGHAVPFSLLRQTFSDSEEIRTRILEFFQDQTIAAAYLSACNTLHGTEARLARWILMVQDRLQTDILPLTQEFLAQMLGSRRMTVATAAGALQRSGLIEYRRGQIRILDREGLEAAACECYRHLQKLYRGLYKS